MASELVHYSAFLSLPNLPQETVEQIQFAARDVLQSLDVTPTYLEFDYAGRDTNRRIVNFLCRIAPLIKQAQGEIECRLSNDDGPDFWEFYTINDYRLYRQRATLLKRRKAEVCQGGEAMEEALSLVSLRGKR